MSSQFNTVIDGKLGMDFEAVASLSAAKGCLDLLFYLIFAVCEVKIILNASRDSYDLLYSVALRLAVFDTETCPVYVNPAGTKQAHNVIRRWYLVKFWLRRRVTKIQCKSNV